MLRNRVIPALLLDYDKLVKGKNFKNHKYVGDPINTVRIFNSKKADELLVYDIDQKNGINFDLLEKISNECRMPLIYGGKIKTVEDSITLMSLGIEKLSFNVEMIKNKNLLEKISSKIGNQSVAITLEIKKSVIGNYNIYTNSGKRKITTLNKFLKDIKLDHVGELFINDISREGTRLGYDLKLLNFFSEKISIPISINGGAGSINDFKNVIENFNNVGVCSGTLFTFQEPHNAVLITYPKNSIYE